VQAADAYRVNGTQTKTITFSLCVLKLYRLCHRNSCALIYEIIQCRIYVLSTYTQCLINRKYNITCCGSVTNNVILIWWLDLLTPSCTITHNHSQSTAEPFVLECRGLAPFSFWFDQSQSHIGTDGHSVSKSWCRAPSGAHDQIFITVWQLRSCFCGAPSLTRGQFCILYMLLALTSTVFLESESLGTRDHILLSLISLSDLIRFYTTYIVSRRTHRKHHFCCQECVFICPLPSNWCFYCRVLLYALLSTGLFTKNLSLRERLPNRCLALCRYVTIPDSFSYTEGRCFEPPVRHE
jgi:hypothetical protein